MKNELVLEKYGVQELQAVQTQDVDGGGIVDKLLEKIVKITDNGTLTDDIKGNTNIDCYIFGFKIF